MDLEKTCWGSPPHRFLHKLWRGVHPQRVLPWGVRLASICGGPVWRTPPAHTPLGVYALRHFVEDLFGVLPQRILPWGVRLALICGGNFIWRTPHSPSAYASPQFVEEPVWRTPPAHTPLGCTPCLNLWRKLYMAYSPVVYSPSAYASPQFVEEPVWHTPPAHTPLGCTPCLNLWRKLYMAYSPVVYSPSAYASPQFVEESVWRTPPARTGGCGTCFHSTGLHGTNFHGACFHKNRRENMSLFGKRTPPSTYPLREGARSRDRTSPLTKVLV